jgi:hypothetical protein
MNCANQKVSGGQKYQARGMVPRNLSALNGSSETHMHLHQVQAKLMISLDRRFTG